MAPFDDNVLHDNFQQHRLILSTTWNSRTMAVHEALQTYLSNSALRFLVFVAIPLILGIRYLSSRFPFPPKAPILISQNYPVVGALGFFTERWTFCQRASTHSPTGNYSFHLGKNPVIGVSGEEGRKVFFENRQLGFSEGYAVMFGQAPDNPSPGNESHFSKWFNNRITSMLKKENFVRGLPQLMADTKARLENIASSPGGITNPFDSVYKIVFLLTMRTVGCNEIANDPTLLAKTLSFFEIIEQSGTPAGVIFPWLPTPAKLKRTYAGVNLYMIFQRIVNERRRTGKREDDALQFMIDHGDDVRNIIGFVIGALFAGQLNSGINAAWVLSYLADNPKWMARAREEVTAVAQKHNPESKSSLVHQLANIPVEAWETEFKFLDCCLKDSIRLQLLGTAFRQNISGEDIRIGDEIVPPGAFLTYHLGHTHSNPAIYPNPDQWDPSRYFPERAEDKKVPYGYVGWGLGRHPCLGMMFAKLEMNVIIAHFLATFDEYHLCNRAGETVQGLPKVNIQGHSASKPNRPVYLKVHRREK